MFLTSNFNEALLSRAIKADACITDYNESNVEITIGCASHLHTDDVIHFVSYRAIAPLILEI